jgi:nitroreductase
MSESAAWYAADGRPGRALYACLVAAAAAPSIHNTQPWLFRPHGARIDVLVDRRRQLNVLDPDGREMFVSVGAALFNLRVAVHAHGRDPRVRLMPDPDEPDLAASVSIERAAVPPEGVLALAGAIPHRHTNRRPFADAPVPPDVLDELREVVAAQRGTLLVADPALREAVLSLTRTAVNQMRDNDRYQAELAEWTTPGGVGRRDGVPRQAFGPRDRLGALPLRDFALGQGAPAATVAFEPDPTLILIFTRGDAPTDWLRAGAALEHVLLTATVHGLAATPLSQIVEVPRLRSLLADAATGQVVQTILRVGYPTTPVPPTPRRQLAEMIIARDDGPAT